MGRWVSRLNALSRKTYPDLITKTKIPEGGKMKKELTSFNLYLCLSLIVFLSLLPLYCISAEENIITLDELVVTATRVDEPKKDIPASIQIITEDDIVNSVSKNVGDIMLEASIGHVQKYPDLTVSSIGLRGLRTDLFDDLKSRVLVLVNGHRIGDVNLSKLQLNDVERIEIVKGPSSVMYGSSAMGGVINIITKEAKGEGIHGYISGDIGSWGYWDINTEISGKKNNFDYYLSLGRSERNDYSAKGYGRIDNTGYNDENISLGVGYTFREKGRFYFKYQHWRGWKIGSPGPTYEHDPDDYSDRLRDNTEVGYKSETFNLNYYYTSNKDEFHESFVTGPWDTPRTVNTKNTDLQGLSIQRIFYFKEHRLVIGGQWDRFDVSNSINIGTPYNPDSKYDSYGLFAEGRLSLLEKRLLVNIGARYDYFNNEVLRTKGFTSLKPREEDLDHLTIRSGLVYQINENFKLRCNFGTAFRAPAPDEVATNYLGSWGIRWLGNPNLNPEKSITYEVGSDYSKGSFESSFTFFHTKFKDKIMSYYNETINTVSFKNVDGATFEGIEGNITYDLAKLIGLKTFIKTFLNVTYLTRYSNEDKNEINKYGRAVLYTPRLTAGAGIRAGQEKWDIRVVVNYTGDEKVQDWYKYPFPVVEKEDFTIVNSKGSFRPLKNFELTLSVENLFDRRYEYVQYYPMPSRTILVSLKWLF
jgi:vitamin B12 transporter